MPRGRKAAVCEPFVPCGKITNGKHYSIITDHLGTPIEAYNQEGELIWEREQDLYGNSRQGFAKENFRCPFKYQGQYYDSEVELCYNRFRYYHPETGRYISEDPIGFLSGEPNFFAYVGDTNAWVDLLGLFRKPINWPSKDKINIDMDHIQSNHTETGSGFIQSSRMGGKKDSFDPNLSKTQIEKKIREAYVAVYSREKVHKEYDKINEEFHTKHKLRGLSKCKFH